ncbi:hypothetical protein GCM10009716_48170 [Streptomyces sodiiphilus]|uniref:Integral membrane protein n=1 Tax=Streptomyces sodiiphilus TaxID=226217 RepID=A0ABN2PX06_9ACTN
MIRRLCALIGVETRAELGAAVLVGISYPLMLAAALVPSVPFFVAAAAVSYAADHFLHRRGSYLLVRLTKARAGLSLRFLFRELLLVLLLAKTGLAGQPVFYIALVACLVFYSLQAPHTALVMTVRKKRRLPIATRNIDLSTLPVPDGAPRALTHRAVEKILHTELPMFAGLVVVAATGSSVAGHIGIAVTMLLALAYFVVLLPGLRPSKLPPPPEETLKWFDGWLRDHRPTVALYFSGDRNSAYQVNMWLETLEELDERAIVILRERYLLPQIATTTLPVVCVPSAVDLMNMDLSMIRVGLYPANVGKNIHLLRVPTMKHVFIGHGDSDKIASVNPYSKAYDEVWTAGRAGRDRWALAAVGVRDEDIVEVGRPQLAPIQAAKGVPAGRIPTVLYAPTWEGWTDDPGNTSLVLAGENIVRRLLDSERPVRVLYKPHPFTGTRCSRAAAAHRRIVAMVERAAAERAADPRWNAEAERTAGDRARALDALHKIDSARAVEATGDELGTWDDAVVSRDAMTLPERAALEEHQRTEWNDAYWQSFGWWEHRVVTGPEPRLFDCFNQCDALVSDISSVVSDFIASGKPYAVADSAGLGHERFTRQNTAVRAAVILSNEATELEGLLDAVLVPESDPLATARNELKSYLLGPDEPTSLERFQKAVSALAAKAEARNTAGTAEQEAAIPAQRGGVSAPTG